MREQAACDRLLDDFRQQHELALAAARPERVTIDVGIALDDHERLRVKRLLAEEGMAAEIRFTDVLKMVIVPTLDDGGRVLLWTAVYEFDGVDYALLAEPQLMSPGSGTVDARDGVLVGQPLRLLVGFARGADGRVAPAARLAGSTGPRAMLQCAPSVAGALRRCG